MIRPIVLTLLASCAVASTFATKHDPLVIWNASASVPIGLYSVQPIGKLAVTDLVVARPPEALQSWFAERRYIAGGALLIKRVAALPGQTICRIGGTVTVDGIDMAEAQERDHAGRPLPVWSGCLPVLPGQVFLLNWDEPSSLDGRYFATIPSENLIGHAVSLWTWE
ncbi:S26 family signal peptidase [Methylocystis sp. SC2]|uniref:S26 family signal peptidase n=1 Tax=Methylocystis sp. (strain SC2) TaxID=187303 RepID=UPI00027AE8DB|nr:S26 family signal peptidase [Methylocystis sp. SC2]CCJ05580.1 Peptidase S26, conserved region [Methylocystis sp. SC2]